MLGYTSSSIMNFRKFKRFLIVFLCVFLMLIPAFSSQAATEDNPGEALTVGVPADRCPIFYEDADTGEIVGIGVDLMRSAAKNAGYNATFKTIEEATLKDALDKQKQDSMQERQQAEQDKQNEIEAKENNQNPQGGMGGNSYDGKTW